MKKEKRKSKIFAIKLTLAALIVITAFLLKTFSPDMGLQIGELVNGDLNYKEAVSAVGKMFDDEEIVEVFEEKESTEEVKTEIEIDESAIEALSFQMSDEELHDDTKAETFRIPPPSYCSYNKVEITFPYVKPLSGKVTSKYGYRDHPIIEDASFHTGIDIAAKSGTAVCCFADGRVLEAKYNDTYGNYVLVEHTGGIRSFYGHNSKLTVKSGVKVKKGQKIAEVGTTGMSTGPHLHFEVRNGKKRLNPAHYIKL
ncbi:MAG: M23 family metallopeptidase [Clostridia bacterium]|nr:M23 family metallopeptidase [Clostridia bacterium]